MNRLLLLIILTLTLIASVSLAAVPQLISYQGRITDSGNNPVTDGSYEITFSLYDVASEGAPFWAETLSTVGVQSGLFNVVLGATNPFGGPAAKRAESDAWLGIKVGSDPELTPRAQLLSVPFAFSADRADTSHFAYQANNSTHSDTAGFAYGSIWSDTSGYSYSAHWSDSSNYALSSGWADTSTHALSVADESVGSSTIVDGSIAFADIGSNGAIDGQIIKWNSSLSAWEAADEVVGSGDITGVLAGTGLAGGGLSGEVVLGIANGGVTSNHIQDGGITAEDLSSFGAVDGQMLKWNSSLSTWEAVDDVGDISSVTAGSGLTGGGASGDVALSIPPGGITSSHIQTNAVTSSDIASDAITTDKIALYAVTSTKIATNSISNAHIQDGTIVSQDIADGQILTADIGSVQITNIKLAPDAVTGDKIADNAITSSQVVDNSLTSSDLGTNSVNSDEIAANAVGNSEIANNAVNTAEIVDNAVTNAKLATNSVGSGEVQDNSLTAIDLVDEPGVAYAWHNRNTSIFDTWVTVETQTIDCPGPGYLVASSNIMLIRENSVLQRSSFQGHLVLDGSVSAYGGYSEWNKDGRDIAIQPQQFVFPVTAGLHTVEVQGRNTSQGSVRVYYVDLSLIYIPTSYGVVMSGPSKSGEGLAPPER